MKTKHCDDCKFIGDLGEHEDGTYTKECGKGHKPKFYMPRGPNDFEYGFKRKCADFERDK
ncbi:MAG: hypothetical protein JRC86_05470 [Deltaproteobacteria bacterium]|nr:hypothetical protein [Deltaproteobacteria bacterium]